MFREFGYVKVILFEEEDDVVFCDFEGKYLVSFDLFDGLLNIEINSFIGIIFFIIYVL